jgi:hypothetical protein
MTQEFRTSAKLEEMAADLWHKLFATPEEPAAEQRFEDAKAHTATEARKIWSSPVRSWADVIARAEVLGYFHKCEGVVHPLEHRAIVELVAAVRLMAANARRQS